MKKAIAGGSIGSQQLNDAAREFVRTSARRIPKAYQGIKGNERTLRLEDAFLTAVAALEDDPRACR